MAVAVTDRRGRLAELLAGDLGFLAPGRAAHPLHALHPFAARFPHGLAGYFINALSAPGEVTLDPMCGSGITLLEGWLAGRSVVGVDLDPLARRQSVARTAALDAGAVRAAGDAAGRRAADLYAGLGQPSDPLAATRAAMDEATRQFVDYWFLPETQAELAALTLAIRAERDAGLRNLLEVVFSSIIVTKSGGVSRARDLAHTRPHRVADKKPRRPLRVFAHSLNRAADAYADVDGDRVGRSSVIAGDARRLPLADSSVDLIVTSPPYANALDYMRAHKFALAWLGDPIPRLAGLRARYIGAEAAGGRAGGGGKASGGRKASGGGGAAAGIALLPPATQGVIDRLAVRDAPKARILGRYCGEMAAAIGEMRRTLRSGGAAVIVVGPSVMRGILIPTHDCLAEIAGEAGLDVVAVAPRNLDRDRRMMPARNGVGAGGGADAGAGIEGRMHTEYIIGAVKP